MGAAVYTQSDFRYVADDGGVNAATLQGTGNNEANVTIDVDTIFRVRFVVNVTGMAVANAVFELWYSHEGGTFTQVTAIGSVIQLTDDTQSIADHATTTQRIGSGTYTTGDSEGFNDGQDNVTGNMDFADGDEVEVECCLSIVGADVADLDTIDLQLELSGGSDLNAYTNSPSIIVNKAAAATDVDCTLGTVVIAGLAATVVEGINVACTVGALVIAGLSATISEGINVDCTTGAVVIAGYAADVVEGIDVDVGTGALVVAGYNATVDVAVTVDVDATTGALVVAGYNPVVEAAAITRISPAGEIMRPYGSFAGKASGVTVEATTGALVVVGYAADVVEGIDVEATTGALVIASFAADVVEGIDVETTTGAIVVAGYAADVIEGIDVEVTTGALTIAGYAAGVVEGIDVACTTGALVIVGLNAVVVEGIDVACTTGALVVVGYAATVETGAGAAITPVVITGNVPPVTILKSFAVAPVPAGSALPLMTARKTIQIDPISALLSVGGVTVAGENPFELVYTGLYDMLAAKLPFSDLIAVGNRLRFDSATDRDPVKQNVHAADLPEVALVSTGLAAGLFHTSSSSMCTRRYTWNISTGDMRITEYLYLVEWAIFCGMTDWRTVLAAIQWQGKSFVKNARLLDLAEGEADTKRVGSIAGWSAIWSCEVEMYFDTADLESVLT